jgi:hypothetical protein
MKVKKYKINIETKPKKSHKETQTKEKAGCKADDIDIVRAQKKDSGPADPRLAGAGG